MILPQLLRSTFTNTCPRCHQGKVFDTDSPYSFRGPFRMRDRCSNCGLRYEREPGFFYGAMYVSYGLMSGLLILWFLADLLWLHLEPARLLACVVSTMLVLFPAVFRWARLIWLNFFFRFDKRLKAKKSDMAS